MYYYIAESKGLCENAEKLAKTLNLNCTQCFNVENNPLTTFYVVFLIAKIHHSSCPVWYR